MLERQRQLSPGITPAQELPVSVQPALFEPMSSGRLAAGVLRLLAERAWSGRVMRAVDLAEELTQPVAQVEFQLERLERAGMIEVNHRSGGTWWTVIDRERYPEQRHELD